jgi:hypothetical protein
LLAARPCTASGVASGVATKHQEQHFFLCICNAKDLVCT